MAREAPLRAGRDEIDSDSSDPEIPGGRSSGAPRPFHYAIFAIAGLVVVAMPFFLRDGESRSTAMGSMDLMTETPGAAKSTSGDDDLGHGPGSSGPLEDLDAWYAMKRNQLIASDRNTNKLFWVPIGSHQVVDDEGPSVGNNDGLNGFDDCRKACEKEPLCNSFTLCGANCYMKSKQLTGNEKTHSNGYCASYFQTADTYRPNIKSLALPSSAPTQTFYVYRAQGPAAPGGDYAVENVNVASLGGVMWYLHDEVIRDCWFGGVAGQRRFGITRIRRFKITTKATQPLYDLGMNFGLKCSFDSGECTGPHKDHVEGRGTGWHSNWQWDHYGFYVGCDNLGEWPHNERVFQSGRRYPNAVWYSLPGSCPTQGFRSSSDDCKVALPGGACSHPDGRGNCTYHIEEAGEIDIDELVGITPKWNSRADFCKQGGFEGNGATGAWGNKLRFWDNIWDESKDHARTKAAADKFKEKYPNSVHEMELVTPKCDTDAQKFLRGQ